MHKFSLWCSLKHFNHVSTIFFIDEQSYYNILKVSTKLTMYGKKEPLTTHSRVQKRDFNKRWLKCMSKQTRSKLRIRWAHYLPILSIIWISFWWWHRWSEMMKTKKQLLTSAWPLTMIIWHGLCRLKQVLLDIYWASHCSRIGWCMEGDKIMINLCNFFKANKAFWMVIFLMTFKIEFWDV